MLKVVSGKRLTHQRDQDLTHYAVELKILAYPQDDLIKEISALISQEKVHLMRMQNSIQDHQVKIDLQIQVKNALQLQNFNQQLRRLSGIHSVERVMPK